MQLRQSSIDTGSQPRESRRWLAFSALMLGLFSIMAAATSVSTALPVIERSLHAGLTQIEWLVDSYFIGLTVLMTTFGRLGDVFGRRRMYLIGSGIFIAGSALSALSRDMNTLIAFRGLTALGPAMMLPATLSLITDLFPVHERGLPMGMWGSMIGVSTGVGPVIGGLLVTDVSWQWVFWINVVLGAVAMAMCAILLPPHPPLNRSVALDLPGIVLNAGFVLCLSFGLVEGHDKGWTSPLIAGTLAISILFLALFIWRELHTDTPMLDLALFRHSAFSAGMITTMTLSLGLVGVFVLLPLFLQGPQHYTALESGLALVPSSIAMAIAGPIGGYLVHRSQPRWPITLSMAMFAFGVLWISRLSLDTDWKWLLIPLLVIGVGLGLGSANINAAAMAVVPRSVAGSAAGVVTTMRQLGQVLGVAVLGAVLQSRQSQSLAQSLPHAHGVAAVVHARSVALTDGLSTTYLVTAAILLAGAVAALFIKHRPLHEDE